MATYAPVCDRTPCTATLTRGTHELVFNLPDGGRISGDPFVTIDGPTKIEATYDPHTETRVAGGLILVGGLAGGIALEYVAATRTETSSAGCGTTQTYDPITGAIGTGTILAGAIVGVLMLSAPNSVHLAVTPLRLGPPAGAREGSAAALPNGLALTARF